MEFYEVIEKRRSIREFQDKPIARNMLELISKELGMDPLDILQDKNGSNVLVSETKVGGKSNG